MKRSRGITVFLVIVSIYLLAGCGKKEYTVEYGVDGYVYQVHALQRAPEGIHDMKVVGEYLYYMCIGENGVYRVPISPMQSGEGGPDFTQLEKALSLPASSTNPPENIMTVIEEEGLASALKREEGEEKKYFQLFLQDYTVDQEYNLYYYVQIFYGGFSSMESFGGILYKKSETGEEIYRRYLTEINDIAVDKDGRACILAEGKICILDAEGGELGTISVEKYQEWGKGVPGELFEDSEGEVYYCAGDGKPDRQAFVIEEKGGYQLRETGLFSGNRYIGHYPGTEGSRILASGKHMLYKYDKDTESARVIMKLIESSMDVFNIQSLVEVTEDRILVSYGRFSQAKLYMLVRTPVEELDQEFIVIASANASIRLEDAVSRFNVENRGFKVILDQYGAGYAEGEARDFSILDASLVSENPPDILDLQMLNVWKYAGKGVLEDLYPYLEKSEVFSAEDFLDNMLEGLTIDGRLVCIPGEIYIGGVAARESCADRLEEWTMESLYRMTENASAAGERLFDDGCGWGWEKDYLLGKFCSAYYLEKFVDWEKRECTFNSAEFGRLLEWVGEHAWVPDDSLFSGGDIYIDSEYMDKEIMLMSIERMTFYSQIKTEVQMNEKTELLGLPTADGRGYYPVEMREQLAITAGSANKERAWEFMEYFLSYLADEETTALKEVLQNQYEEAVRQEYQRSGEEGGEDIPKEKGMIYVGGDLMPYYAIPRDQADRFVDMVRTADFTPPTEEEEEIIKIVSEEAGSYFTGDKSLEEVTDIIQNRVQLLLEETKK